MTKNAYRNIYNQWVLHNDALRINAIASDDDVAVHDGAVWLRFPLVGSAEPISAETTARLERVLDRNRSALLNAIVGAQIGFESDAPLTDDNVRRGFYEGPANRKRTIIVRVGKEVHRMNDLVACERIERR
jgi:hypothetical protein